MLATPTCLKVMSVAVLSLWQIIASSAARSETLSFRFGGLNNWLSTFQTLS
jgi:hypothetical protein